MSSKYAKDLCTSGLNDCYLLDNNAFIIYSKENSQTGRFFGEVDNSLLQAMVGLNIYRKVHMYDYQAICLDIEPHRSLASILATPLHHMKSIIFWFWTRVFTLYINIWYNSWLSDASGDYDGPDYGDYDYECKLTRRCFKAMFAESSGCAHSELICWLSSSAEKKNNKTRPFPCDKEFDLYEMMANLSEEPIRGDHSCGVAECSRLVAPFLSLPSCHVQSSNWWVAHRNFMVQAVPYTNLLLVVVHKSCACDISTIKFEPKQIVYNKTQPCDLLKTEMLRKRPTTCHSYHPQVRRRQGDKWALDSTSSLPLYHRKRTSNNAADRLICLYHYHYSYRCHSYNF